MKWEKVEIQSVCEGIYDGPHATPPISDTGAIFLGISNITQDGHLDFSNVKYISEKDLPKWTKRVTPRKNDIVFSYEATLNLYAKIPENFWGCLGRRMALIRPNPKKISGDFLYYYFFSDQWRNVIAENIVTGATVDRIPLIRFPTFPINIPPLKIQQKIASILSAYDDLIENNKKQIKLLEEAAQRLYKEWFIDLRFPGHENSKIVDGVPEGWKVCTLQDVIEFDPKIKLAKDRIKQCVPMAALSTSSMVLDSTQFTDTLSNSGSKFQNGDTLLARITPCLENGKIAFVQGIESEEGAIGSTEYIVMRSRRLNPYMVYLLARTEGFREFAISSMTGSDGRQRVNSAQLKSLDFILPPQGLINIFEGVIAPLFNKIYKLNQHNIKLGEARDLLLPKLMTGEIEV